MRSKHLDLIVALLFAAMNVGCAFLPVRYIVVSIVCALPLVFLIPGYTLTEAVFQNGETSPRQADQERRGVLHPVTTSDRLILGLGLSLAIVIINGLVLNILPMGLDEATWAISLAALTAVFSLIALFRRRNTSRSPKEASRQTRRLRISVGESLLSLVALAIVASSIWYAVSIANQQQQQTTFTQFWMVPSKQANHSCAVLIGIQNLGASSEIYNIAVTANNAQIANWSDVTLKQQAQWYQSLPITTTGANSVAVVARLYRADQPTILYREAHLTLDISITGQLAC